MKEKIIINCYDILKCDDTLFKMNNKDLSDDILKEKLYIYNTYYNFIKNEKCILFIEKIFNEVNKYNFLKQILNEEKILLNLMIIFLKSFLDKKIISYVGESYIDSDDILNYVVENFFYYLLLSNKYIPKKSISLLCLNILDILIDAKLINMKKITIINKNIIKTIKYLNIEECDYNKSINTYMIFSYTPYKLIQINDEYYITTYHYSKTSEIYKKNFNSNKKFNLKNINYIMNKINIKLYVDNEYQKILLEKLNIDITKLQQEIENNIIKLNKLYNLDKWCKKTTDEISKLQSENSKLLDDILYHNFSKYEFNDDYIFFPIFLDFRGRKYYYSKIGPTSSKILRPAFYYGWYNNNDFDEKNNKYSKKYYNIINNFCENNDIINEKKFYESYFWLLIGIGKFFIDKNKYPIKTIEFIELGIINFNNLNKLKIEDYLEAMQYNKIIKQMNEKKIKKRTLVKDATASLNQIFMKKLGPLDQNSMNYVNLGNEHEWFDTYLITRKLYYINIVNNDEFKEFHNENLFNTVLPRPLIKNMIMIIPYSAGDELCLENYKEGALQYNIDITISLEKLLLNFFNFIRKDLQEFYLYNKTSTTLTNKMSEDFEIYRKYLLESETGIADISYYIMEKASIDKKYKINEKNKRITKLILKPSKALDKKAFNTALGANVIHFLDADEIRILENLLGYSVITIHDCYLIDFNNCTNLIDHKINHYQKEINKITNNYKINNIFILK